MAPGSISEAVQKELAAEDEPWPEDTQLFQPFEVEQILLADNANTLAVQAFLLMAKLPFKVEMRGNAESMSPNGKIPFIRAGKFVISELNQIISFAGSKGTSLTEHLDQSQKNDMSVYMSLVSNVLGNAENFVSWCEPVTLEQVTKPRYGSVFPWPLNFVLNWQKKSQITKKLSSLGWGDKSLEEVYSEVDKCCQTLSTRLDNSPYFFNNRPTELDALVFGHLFAILTTPLPDNRLESIIRQHTNLVEFCQRIDKAFFATNGNGSSSSGSNDFEKI